MKLRKLWTKRTLLSMDLKKIWKAINNKFLHKKKRTTKSGKNGKKAKRKDLMIWKKKSKNSTKKSTSSGKIITKIKTPTGNKNITSIGFNGK